MRAYGRMNQTVMHCIFVGAAEVRKSSLLKRLLCLKLNPKRISTRAVEKSIQVEISREVSTNAAQMSAMDWQIIEDPFSQASGFVDN